MNVTGDELEKMESLANIQDDAKYLDRTSFRRKYGMSLFTAKQRGLVPQSLQRVCFGRPEPPRLDTSATTVDQPETTWAMGVDLATQPATTVVTKMRGGVIQGVFDLEEMKADAQRMTEQVFRRKYGMNVYWAKKQGVLPWDLPKVPKGEFCFYCGGDEPTTLDHVFPRVRGGTDDPGNLVWACTECNKLKKEHTLDQHRIFEARRWGVENLLFAGETNGLWEEMQFPGLPHYYMRNRLRPPGKPCIWCGESTRNRGEVCTPCRQKEEEALLTDIW